MTQTEPQPEKEPFSLQALYASGDYQTFDHLYEGLADALGGSVRKAPVMKHGRPNWKAPIEEFALALDSQSIQDAARKCVFVRDIVGCDATTEVIVFFAEHSGENPFVRQIAGPPADQHIASLIVYRTLGSKPPMIPALRTEPVEVELAANDNRLLVPVPPMHADPFDPDAAGELLSGITKWITSTAIVPVQELSLISAIALMSGVFGKMALGPTNSGVNLYMTTLLATAGGKGHPPKAVRSLGDKCGRLGAVSNGDPTSYAAIERLLRKNPSTVITMDEFGITLQDVNGKHQNSVAASIRKMLLAVYDQSNSVFDGRIYASSETKKDDGPIVGPALTVLAMTTPATLYQGLSAASVSDGFINRFLFISADREASEIRPPRLGVDHSPPASLIEALQDAISAFPFDGQAKTKIDFEGGEDGDAYQRWSQIFLWQHSRQWDDTQRNINGRAAENTIRLATVRAISRNPAEPIVDVADVEWGWAIVYGSINLIAEGVARHMSSSPAEALRKAIIEVLREATDRTMPFSTMLRKKGIAGADLRELEGALAWLAQSGEITDLNSRPRPGAGSKFRCNDLTTKSATAAQS